MAAEKRIYWLKLKEDFFRDRDIKKLRSMAGGDTLTVIYLEMLLLALPTDGKLEYTGLEDDFASEIALTIDENPDNVSSVVSFLIKRGLMVEGKPDEYELIAHMSMVGSESGSAERMRRMRNRVAAARNNVRNCDTDIDIKDVDGKDIEGEIDCIEGERDTTPTNISYKGDSAYEAGGGFSPDILQYAREQSRGADNPAAYERSILARIKRAGFTTLEEVLEDDRKRKAAKQSVKSPDQGNTEYKQCFPGEIVV